MKKYKYKFSIIIPIYNVEDYLEETIESVINQSIGFESNVQMILVNDGSPDNSEEICLKYTKMYPDNILYIKQENGGVSSARNNGLKYAEGKYINFLDSDDKWNLDVFEKVYDFFENNYDEIDVVACRLKYFEARQGYNHPLNYKFTSNRLIDVSEKPNMIQMHAASCFVKNSAIGNVIFSKKLKYGEDSLFINQIILKKLKYGVMRNAVYLYRKRFNETSALDRGHSNPSYYNDTLKYFHDEINKLSKKMYKEIIPYIQYVSMYDLQWRIKRTIEPGVLNDEELKDYMNHIELLLRNINDSVIMDSKNIWKEHKLYALSLKYDCDIIKKCEFHEDSLYFNGYNLLSFKDHSILKINVINISKGKFQIAGQVNCPINEKDYCIYIETNGKKEKLKTIVSPFNSKQAIDGELYSNLLFNNNINFNDKLNIKFYISYKDEEILMNPSFTQNGRISELMSLHYNKDGYMCYYENNTIIIEKNRFTKSFNLELKVLNSIIKDKKRNVLIYRLLAKILKMFKRKEIWFVSDRTMVANDNGMHLFKYINSINHKEKVYFIIDKKSSDYNEMKKYGKVIAYNTLKYKLYYFLADKVISSQADVWVLNPFGRSEKYYRDIFTYDFVFLQHGVTKDDISSWLNLYNKNIRMFVTSSNDEYDSLINGTYYYDKNVVKLTGMPRFDNLYDESKKKIAILPTWRKALSGHSNVSLGTRDYNPSFKESEYFKFYNSLINDEKLLAVMKKNGYNGLFLVHPSHKENSIDFKSNDIFTVIDGFADYQEIFKEASLLVSDFSSVPFDFAYLYKPVIYSQFDKESFFENHIYGEGYFSYEKDGFGPVTYDYQSTINEIIKAINNNCKIEKKYENRINKFYKYHDHNNCKRVYEEIKKI